ncbi:MAG: threonine synthase [Dehalococcoidia bacterium]|nr:threonine synthase [Dehalococcoidia bacterium]MDW8120314.1 threonine synthase [Chloroflexota bacterium]
MRSYLSHLECTACGRVCSAEQVHTVCPACGRVLYARYDLERARNAVDPKMVAGRPRSMWRWWEVLPVRDPRNIVSLGEGDTPLLPAPRLGQRLGCARLYIKDESLNPTGTFKARGQAAAVSRAKELGVKGLVIPSAGNAAGAMAAYAARAGLPAYVFMPQDAPEANKKECAVAGAHLELVAGHIGDAGRLSRVRAQELGLLDVSTLREPYRVEGKKIMGYEIVEGLGWRYPGAIVYPTGGGTGLVGMWKAFDEMEALGWVEGPRPKMFCVQAEGCAPIVRAFQEGKERAEPFPHPQTIASGLRVPAPFADYLILQVVRASGGSALAVSDREMVECVREMASLEGVFACPEGAATLAGLKRLLAEGRINPDEPIILLNTGSGLKYLDVL